MIKKCSKCNQEKDISCFSNAGLKRGKSYIHPRCKLCRSELQTKWVNKKLPPPKKIEDLPNEIWKQIPVKGLYMVSYPYGRVKSYNKRWFRDEKLLTPVTKNICEYPCVKLTYKYKETVYKVHRLVAQAFIPNPENKPQVNHKDGNKKNFHADNLEWATGSENMRHAIDILKIKRPKAELHYSSKITNKQALEIFNSKDSPNNISLKYAVSANTVRDIKRGKNWNSVTNKKLVKIRKEGKELISMVMDICFSSTKPKDLCIKYNMPYPTLKHIRRGGSYSDISGIKYIKKTAA